ncbi:MAG TPA: cytochrome c [Terriglobales bacterium]|nr:cytochrome c [Terriglobales bacterium]
MRRHVVLLCALAALSASAAAQDPAAYFKTNCMSCHTVGGGRLAGPDLKDVTQRRDKAWLVQWMQSPRAVLDSGDAYAQKMLQDSRGVVMPPPAGMNPQLAAALVDLLDAESKLPRSQFAGVQISDRPFNQQDVALGLALFTGEKRMANGGPACISCHTMKGMTGLHGGRLGPDLTLVYERLQGRKGLGAWLGAPASPTMAPVFKATALSNDEIFAMTALFEHETKQRGHDDQTPLLNFFLLGVGGAVVGLVTFDRIWKKRLTGVRRQLVHRSRGEE